jgi:hypothetical protein
MERKLLKTKQNIWDREFLFSTQPKYWKSQAIQLYSCASLLERNWVFFINDENVKGGIQEQFFSAPKFIRMFWGYTLENLMKGLLLNSETKDKYINSNKISWGKNGHNLLWLKNELKYNPTFELPKDWYKVRDKYLIDVDFYLEIWSISATWYGKYPFPSSMNGVLDEYSSGTREELFKRVIKGKRKTIISDIIGSDISIFEKTIFENIYNDLLNKINE